MKNSKEPVIVIKNKLDKVCLENTDKFDAFVTIGLEESGDYHVKIDFQNLSQSQFKKLVQYSKLNRRLEFSSDIIKQEKYNITHIVVTDFSANNLFDVSWNCLSDDPRLYEGLKGE